MGKPKRIILIRHGQSEGNIDKAIYRNKPDYAVELTSEGRKQAFLAGQELSKICDGKPAMFYVSPFWRTRQTFQEISKSVLVYKYYEDPRLREQEWGTGLQKETIDERERLASGHFYYRFKDGESCADVYDRVSDFLNTLFRDFEKEDFPENVIIVNHGMTLRTFLMRWLHWTVEEFEILRNPKNAEYHILENTDVRYKLITELKKYKKYTHPFQFKW